MGADPTRRVVSERKKQIQRLSDKNKENWRSRGQSDIRSDTEDREAESELAASASASRMTRSEQNDTERARIRTDTAPAVNEEQWRWIGRGWIRMEDEGKKARAR